jgi:hypothetical protein
LLLFLPLSPLSLRAEVGGLTAFLGPVAITTAGEAMLYLPLSPLVLFLTHRRIDTFRVVPLPNTIPVPVSDFFSNLISPTRKGVDREPTTIGEVLCEIRHGVVPEKNRTVPS